MPTSDEFRLRLAQVDKQTVVEEFLMSGASAHVATETIDKIGDRICAAYGAAVDALEIWVVGSAKLGFSIAEKKLRDGTVLPRYRQFRPDSDIDIAIVHPDIFRMVWHELTEHAHRAQRWPWDSGRLGDYLVTGWLRPDHFPRHVRLPRCDQWQDCFRSISNDATFGRRKITGGLFYSREQLARYQQRAVDDCIAAEELLK